jgi:hypothetical protein
MEMKEKKFLATQWLPISLGSAELHKIVRALNTDGRFRYGDARFQYRASSLATKLLL